MDLILKFILITAIIAVILLLVDDQKKLFKAEQADFRSRYTNWRWHD